MTIKWTKEMQSEFDYKFITELYGNILELQIQLMNIIEDKFENGKVGIFGILLKASINLMNESKEKWDLFLDEEYK